MLSQTDLGNINQTTFLCSVAPALLTQHYVGYFPNKSCMLLTMGQHFTGDFFVQLKPRQNQKTLQIIFLCKVVCELWFNIPQGQHSTGNFLVEFLPRQIKTTLYRLSSCKNMIVRSGRTLQSNFLVQCCLRRTQVTLTR